MPSRARPQLLERWLPGATVTLQWTGEAYMVQVAHRGRMGTAVCLTPAYLLAVPRRAALRRTLLVGAGRLLTSGQSVDRWA